MKKFWSEHKIPVMILIIGLPLLYCSVQNYARSMAQLGCHMSTDYDGTYQARVFCNNKADAISWGWYGDFEGFGKVYTYDKTAEIYVEKH